LKTRDTRANEALLNAAPPNALILQLALGEPL
jgi:hypothetical protein